MSQRSDMSAQRSDQRPRIICIAGPTASGKTALSIRLARELGGEIVNADSVQLFRRFDIGSAKATHAERTAVPHHGLDVLAPDAHCSAAEFASLADGWIGDILARGAVPILVGGSGLYLRALIYGLNSGPPRDDALRDALRERAEREGSDVLHRELRDVDPEYAAKIHHNDLIRIVRALEVYRLTGGTLSAHHAADEDVARYRVAGVALTADRGWLYERINRRVARMLDEGLVDEVAELLRDGVDEDAQAMAAIGYRQTLRWLRRHSDSEPSSVALQELEDEIAARTRNFAKRQMVWFRKESVFRWFDAQSPQRWMDELSAALRAFVAEGRQLRCGADSPEAALEASENASA